MSDRRIQAVPLSVKIADALRDAIVCGELRQGDPITQDGVAKEYSVSSMPAREALLLLAHEGMIDARPNKGFRVARMWRQDVEDIFWTHGVLAGRLAARASQRLSDSDLLKLEENNERLEEAIHQGDMEEVEDLNWQYHRIINVAADSPKILAFLKTTLNQIPKRFYTMLVEWDELSLHDHAELLRALRRKNATTSERLASAHVAAAGRLMIDYLASQGYWDDPPEPIGSGLSKVAPVPGS
jgi:DNA-binding GntR family transcriptional regulator